MSATAVPPGPGSADPGIPWHYGDPLREQSLLLSGRGAVDLSNRGVVTVRGTDRLSWLHSLTTAHLEQLQPGSSALALILSPHGHVEHELHLVDDGATTFIITQPGTSAALVDYLDRMRFMLQVEVADASEGLGVVWEPHWTVDDEYLAWLVPADYAGTGVVAAGADRGGDASKYIDHRPAPFAGREVIVPRDALMQRMSQADGAAGSWALEALRVAAAVPRLGLETDHRTLPHEVGWIGPGVHLSKGCYRGQEAVARVHNLGHPPRRLVLLHLDGSDNILPSHGDAVVVEGKAVGWIGTAAQHCELGPIATAVVKRSTPVVDCIVQSTSGDVVASQEAVVSAAV